MKRKALIAGVTAAALVTGGTATAFAVAGEDGGATAARVTAAQAVDAAQGKASGKVVSVGLDDDRPAWDVDVLNGNADREFTVDAGTGKVLGSHKDDVDADDIAAAKAARTDVKTAIGAAQRAVPGTVTSADLDDDRPVWDVDVHGKDGKEHDVTVDARTGKVVSTHVDDED